LIPTQIIAGQVIVAFRRAARFGISHARDE
jgi:hypothetical protein